MAQLNEMVKSDHSDVCLLRKFFAMRCEISSRAGQVLAEGQLFIESDENGELWLSLRTTGGRLIRGGAIDSDGNMANASQVLFRQFFEVWGMSDLTLSIRVS
jgi:hypothetical protein